MDIIKQRLQESINLKQQIIEDDQLLSIIKEASDLIIHKIKAGGTAYFCGNGGSAADAQHLAAELSGRFYIDRKPLAGEALHCNTSFLTAVGNDYSFDLIYSRLLEGIGRKGDILIGLSTSGNSKNIINAVLKAKEIGISSIILTGKTGGQLKTIANLCICVPSKDTPRIQEAHITIGHIICEMIEENLFGNDNKK